MYQDRIFHRPITAFSAEYVPRMVFVGTFLQFIGHYDQNYITSQRRYMYTHLDKKSSKLHKKNQTNGSKVMHRSVSGLQPHEVSHQLTSTHLLTLEHGCRKKNGDFAVLHMTSIKDPEA